MTETIGRSAGVGAIEATTGSISATAFFAGGTGSIAGVRYFLTDCVLADGVSAGAILFVDRNGDGVSDQSVVLVGQSEATMSFNDIIG